VTRRTLTFLLFALAGLLGWVGGVLAYVNWFSESGRAGGDAVKAAMWASAAVGLLALVGFGASLRRGSHA
jgi:hypothetical protein